MTTYPALSASDPGQFSFGEGEDGWGYRDKRVVVFCSTDCRAEYVALAPEMDWQPFETTRTQGTAFDGTPDVYGARCSKCGKSLLAQEV